MQNLESLFSCGSEIRTTLTESLRRKMCSCLRSSCQTRLVLSAARLHVVPSIGKRGQIQLFRHWVTGFQLSNTDSWARNDILSWTPNGSWKPTSVLCAISDKTQSASDLLQHLSTTPSLPRDNFLVVLVFVGSPMQLLSKAVSRRNARFLSSLLSPARVPWPWSVWTQSLRFVLDCTSWWQQ